MRLQVQFSSSPIHDFIPHRELIQHPSRYLELSSTISRHDSTSTALKATMSFSVKASLSLNVIVVGGGERCLHPLCSTQLGHLAGISGLAVAFRLAQAGHVVRVVDKSRPDQVRIPAFSDLTRTHVSWLANACVVCESLEIIRRQSPTESYENSRGMGSRRTRRSVGSTGQEKSLLRE